MERRENRGEERMSEGGQWERSARWERGHKHNVRALSNENPISKSLLEFMGRRKKSKQKEELKLACWWKRVAQMSSRRKEKEKREKRGKKSIANPQGLKTETMIFYYQMLCSQFQTRARKEREGGRKRERERERERELEVK